MKYLILFSFIFLIGFSCAENASISDVQIALDDSLGIINELSSQGFSIAYVNDSYSEALLVFQQAGYADILRNKSILESDQLKIEAKNNLKLVSWANITYDKVLEYVSNIKQYKIDAYYIFDSINSLDKRIKGYAQNKINVSLSEELLNSANISFYNGQFNDSMTYIEKAKAQIESDVAGASGLSVLADNAKNFFFRYIYLIIFVLIVISVSIYFLVKYVRLRLLKIKINKMEIEEKVLNNLIRKNQIERYKENKISDMTYNLRAGKYQFRLSEIKQELPVLKKHFAK